MQKEKAKKKHAFLKIHIGKRLKLGAKLREAQIIKKNKSMRK
jgi:hypothetical protein